MLAIAVTNALQITLRTAVASRRNGWLSPLSRVVVIDLFAQRGEAFFQQPLRNMLLNLRVGATCRLCFTEDMQGAVCALDQPKTTRIMTRRPVLITVKG